MVATRPLQLLGGAMVEGSGSRLRFEGGRATEVEAERNADAIRGHLATDEGAVRLREVALLAQATRYSPDVETRAARGFVQSPLSCTPSIVA